MSESILKLIPASPDGCFDDDGADRALVFLRSALRPAEAGRERWEHTMFVDCGGNLEEIRCPLCGAVLDFGWWGETMDGAAGTGFAQLSVTVPCCGGKTSLDALCYHFPCGFAKEMLWLRDPEREITKKELEQIQWILGQKVRVIRSHM